MDIRDEEDWEELDPESRIGLNDGISRVNLIHLHLDTTALQMEYSFSRDCKLLWLF
jgi:hypothetical protein